MRKQYYEEAVLWYFTNFFTFMKKYKLISITMASTKVTFK